jgi:hypothetical protein
MYSVVKTVKQRSSLGATKPRDETPEELQARIYRASRGGKYIASDELKQMYSFDWASALAKSKAETTAKLLEENQMYSPGVDLGAQEEEISPLLKYGLPLGIGVAFILGAVFILRKK